jgi:molybdopterin converting factor small subunit
MDKMNVKIVCFAGLRKYFGSEATVPVESGTTYAKVIDELISLKPEAQEVLTSSRIAVNEEFVSLTETIQPGSTLFLIPPSSGG